MTVPEFTKHFCNRIYARHLLALVLLAAVAAFCLKPLSGLAEFAYDYTNTDTGYGVVIDDMADLLTDGEETQLMETMSRITVYCDVAFVTIDENSLGSATAYAEQYYDANLGSHASGLVLLIDMDNRMIILTPGGTINRKFSVSDTEAVTDNCYSYASKGDYYSCAVKAMNQIYNHLGGKPVPKPMKYICNALLALIAAFMINYIVVKTVSLAKRPADKQILDALQYHYQLNGAHATLQSTKRVPLPKGGVAVGGGGGGFHGGGGGGGHHSGGHSF